MTKEDDLTQLNHMLYAAQSAISRFNYGYAAAFYTKEAIGILLKIYEKMRSSLEKPIDCDFLRDLSMMSDIDRSVKVISKFEESIGDFILDISDFKLFLIELEILDDVRNLRSKISKMRKMREKSQIDR